MRKSTVYFLVALTMLSLSLCLVPTALSKTEDIKIVSKSWYFDTAGYFDAVGEVQNLGSSAINSVYLGGTVTFTDGTQKVTTAQVWVQYLAPQQKAPFYLTFMVTDITGQSSQTYTLSDVANVQVDVLRADTTDKYQYQGLTITTQSSSIDTTTDNKGTYWVSGTLKNTGSETAKNIRILGTFYNAAGNVVAVGGYGSTEVLSASLASSATIDFDIGAYDVNQTSVPSDTKITTYTLLVQAESPVPTGTAPQVTPYPSNTFPTNSGTTAPNDITSPTTPPTDSTSPTDSQSPISGDSNTSPPVWIYAVVTVVALAAVVGVVLVLRKRKAN